MSQVKASQNPVVSVVMVTYNQANFIRQALDSLLAQSISRDLVQGIIINDGSTDDTERILQSYAPHVHVISRENRGLVAGCNEGLELAVGTYFARLDSDDFTDPTWLEKLTGELDRDPAAVCVYPDRFVVEGSARNRVTSIPGNLYSLEACGTLFRTAILKSVGGFRNFFWEEYDLYLRLRARGRFLHVPEPLYTYRRHPGGMTSDPSRRRAGWEELLQTWSVKELRAGGFNRELEDVLSEAVGS